MEKIAVLSLLKKYREWVKQGAIQFLKKGSEDQKDILKDLDALISDFKKAEEKKKKLEGDISETLDWAETHKKGRELWQKLASCALNNIDKESKGNSELFKFLEAATRFEDVLYGIERYYRDHTLHSLWVYFMGEYILRDLLPEIHNNLNWFLFNDIEYDKSLLANVKNEAQKREKQLIKEVNKRKDAIWCIMALCHDLGYSLEKLAQLNQQVTEVLKFIHLPEFNRIGYSLDIEHKYLVTQFLELMAMDVILVPSVDAADVLIKCYRDDATYWQLCRALEKKQHGILGSYLIYKILGIFADASVRGTAEEWGLEDIEAVENLIRGDILFAIAQHTLDFAYLNQLSSLADILILADELEEFSRFGRDMLSRKYYDTTAKASVSFKPINPKLEQSIDIYINYEVAQHENLFEFFKRKAEKLCRFYSLELPIDKRRKKFCKIQSIKMVATKNNQELFFHTHNDASKNRGYLPQAEIDGVKHREGEYKVSCHDDMILIHTKKRKISLEEWGKNVP